MTDTIKLKFEYLLPQNSFYFLRVPGKSRIYTNNHWRKSKQLSGFYMPKYWIERDFRNSTKTYFCFEASLPKLLHGENIKEIEESDFDEVIEAINAFFIEIDITVSREEIINAIPRVIAIGKNIDISDLCSSSAAIELLKPFDYKSRSRHRTIEFSDCGYGGKELMFSVESETLKVYEKMKEIANNKTQTAEEQAIVKKWQDSENKNEILRFELTLKNKRKIASKLKPYLNGAEPSLKNIFKKQLWQQVLGQEVKRVFNSPLKDLILLSGNGQNYIDGYLNAHCHQVQTRETTRAVIMSIKEIGFNETRRKYLTQFKSSKSWYNLQRRLADFDYSELTQTTSKQVHSEILKRLEVYG